MSGDLKMSDEDPIAPDSPDSGTSRASPTTVTSIKTFHLNPTTTIDGVLDFTEKNAKKIYDKAVKSLYPSDDLYQCEPAEMFSLLKSLKNKANEFGWDNEQTGILYIPEDPYDPLSDTKFLPTEYGQIDIETITKFEKSYLGKPIRPAQDSYMLYQCLLNSLSKEAKIKIQVWESEYIIMNDSGTYIPSGNLLLKVIIRESHLDTNATTQSIRTKLSNLDVYINTINSDITRFNGYVKGLVLSLSARGQRTEDLLSNLFKGYLAASDKVFVKYISGKMEKYEEGKDIPPDKLMQLADNKYRLMKEKQTWEAPSEEEEKILALQAELNLLKKKSNRKDKENKRSGRIDNGNRRKTTPSHKAARNNKRNNNAPSPKPAWMKVKPTKEEIHKPKEWNGTTWWWCGKETGGKCDPAQWRAHQPKECRGTMRRRPQSSHGVKNKNNGQYEDLNNENKKLKISEALASVAEAEDEETHSDSSGYESH